MAAAASSDTASKSGKQKKLKVLLPGDVVQLGEEAEKAKRIRLGPGLRQEAPTEGAEEKMKVVASKCGLLREHKQADFWLDANQKRAVPVLDEQVIGVITALGESYAVDIGVHVPASLSSLAFEGATKRNKPQLKIGDLVYARLTIANKDMEPEIECMDKSGKAAGMGPLSGGYLFTCSLGLCRKLLRPDNALLQRLGELCPFEMAVGMNGRVWVDAKPAARCVLLANAMLSSEFMSEAQIETLVRTVAARM